MALLGDDMYIKALYIMLVFFCICGALAALSGAKDQASYFGTSSLLMLILIETAEVSKKLDRMNGT